MVYCNQSKTWKKKVTSHLHLLYTLLTQYKSIYTKYNENIRNKKLVTNHNNNFYLTLQNKLINPFIQ